MRHPYLRSRGGQMSYSPGKPKSANRLSRKSRGIKEFTRVLIVCEGSSTEPNYLRDLCKSLGLAAKVVEVIGEKCGSAPMSVYEFAADQVSEDGAFDEVYCVFDRDTHETFQEALHKIATHRCKKMQSIVSYPCFEYWIFLHFAYTRTSMPSVGTKSCGRRMLDLLREKWPEYEKGSKDVYTRLAEKNLTDTAIKHSAWARKDAETTRDPDPSTDVDKLVVRLRKLGEEFAAIAG